MNSPLRVSVVDSHTGGEPTRVVLSGGPLLEGQNAADKLRDFCNRFDSFRRAVTCEPRGSDVLVGALLVPPSVPDCAAGVIFFNNVGYLGMCGHGTIGVVATLAYLEQISPGEHRFETPVGVVSAHLDDDGSVSIRNVPAYRYAHQVSVAVEGFAPVTGDVAWGGNWFFLCDNHEQLLEPGRVAPLTDYAEAVRRALVKQGTTGYDGAEIDHIELVAPSPIPGINARNFVLCPGGAYDRSPCGTGTSAKLACLAADSKLQPGQVWRQESIVGSVFEGSFEIAGATAPGSVPAVVPTIRGRAHITAEATLLLDPDDPFCWGLLDSKIDGNT